MSEYTKPSVVVITGTLASAGSAVARRFAMDRTRIAREGGERMARA